MLSFSERDVRCICSATEGIMWNNSTNVLLLYTFRQFHVLRGTNKAKNEGQVHNFLELELK